MGLFFICAVFFSLYLRWSYLPAERRNQLAREKRGELGGAKARAELEPFEPPAALHPHLSLFSGYSVTVLVRVYRLYIYI